MNKISIWDDFSPFTIGFGSVFNELDRVRSLPQTNYPPYNIRKGAEEDSYIIELALAGFSEEDVTVSVIKIMGLFIKVSHKENSQGTLFLQMMLWFKVPIFQMEYFPFMLKE